MDSDLLAAVLALAILLGAVLRPQTPSNITLQNPTDAFATYVPTVPDDDSAMDLIRPLT